MTFKVLRRRGRYLQSIPEAPLFDSYDDAAKWAATYMGRPDFPRGLEGVDVRRVPGAEC